MQTLRDGTQADWMMCISALITTLAPAQRAQPTPIGDAIGPDRIAVHHYDAGRIYWGLWQPDGPLV